MKVSKGLGGEEDVRVESAREKRLREICVVAWRRHLQEAQREAQEERAS